MEPLPQALQNLEQQLRAFVPQAPHTSHEQMLYQAGWEAALAQQSTTGSVSPAAPVQSLSPQRTDIYWAAACAALLLLSTALGWQVWQQPTPPGLSPQMATTTPTQPLPATKPAPAVAISAPSYELPRSTKDEPSALASYLELRQRVTRGGLSMWPVSTPASVAPNEAEPVPARDWQAELLREAL